jgi:UPF0755 protein
MSTSRRDESGSGGGRTAEDRERARLEREARRRGSRPSASAQPARPSTPSSGAAAPPDAAQQSEHAAPIPIPRTPRTAKPAAAGRRPAPRAEAAPSPPDGGPVGPVRPVAPPPARRAGRRRTGADAVADGSAGVRRIQPQPPAPPAAPAGALGDETERPIGIRKVRRAPRPVVTPPGDKPGGPARRRHRSVGGRLLGLFALAVLAVIVIGALMLFQPFGSAEGTQVEVTIPQGSSARGIGDQLAQAGVVDSGLLFSVRAMLSGKRESLRSGRVTLRRDMSYGKAIAALSEKEVTTKAPTIDVTIPEGRSRREIAPIARRAGLAGDYLVASKRFKGALNPFRYGAPPGTRSLEGFLFPATYELRPRAPARDLVERQLATFKERFARVDLSGARRKNLTGYDVLIIASMVEREAQLEKDRPLIAAVIYNRLKDGIPLGIDATSRYALNKPSGALTQSELEIDSPYNTRKRAGLPPTPIGNPGLSSIRAAATPANVPFRYFVVKPGTCGEHVFSSDYDQFMADKRRYDDARRRLGRSPVQC